jgi:hypothetical protein
MLQVVLTSGQNAVRRKRIRGNPKEPWATDHPWRPEEMAPDYGGETGGAVLGRVAFLALIGLFNIALGSDEIVVKIVVLAFDLLGLLILYDSVQKLVQAARHVRPRMRWLTFPTFVGGRLEGMLLLRPGLSVNGPVRATLRCVQDVRTARTKQQASDFEAFVIYKQVQEIPTGGGKLENLGLGFDVPPDLPGTHLGRMDATYWQVAFEIPVTGPDFEAVFLAPVYQPR